METVLVTGGAGYIGSHTSVELLQAGYRVVVVDSLANASEEALRRVERITGRSPIFHRVDLLDRLALDTVFLRHRGTEAIRAVVHFAGLKAVGESVEQPLAYFHNNIAGTITLLQVMEAHGVRDLVFSSSSTVYSVAGAVPFREDGPLGAFNPYGQTKLTIEDLLRGLHAADDRWTLLLLRYFNPVGAHPSGLLGEDPRGIPSNLMPYITQVAVGRHGHLSVFGRDYPTPDGTGVRDYLHVVDLAQGHLAALRHLGSKPGCRAYNLGTGQGYSVLEVLSAMNRAVGRELPYRVAPRRPGDAAVSYCDPTRAREELGWTATRDLDAMCQDAWRFQQANPDGYGA